MTELKVGNETAIGSHVYSSVLFGPAGIDIEIEDTEAMACGSCPINSCNSQLTDLAVDPLLPTMTRTRKAVSFALVALSKLRLINGQTTEISWFGSVFVSPNSLDCSFLLAAVSVALQLDPGVM